MSDLRKDLAAVLNSHSAESKSNTPDFILAEFLVGCLEAWDKSHAKRDVWRTQQFDESVTHVWVSLEPGDLIWEDDEYLDLTIGGWKTTACFGEVYSVVPFDDSGEHHRPHRRLFAVGYRWLRRGDVVIPEDEIVENGSWIPVGETGAYDPVSMKPVRRRIQ